MMIVHQAIYGDKSGAYALLKTSLTDTERAKRICNVTDLLDRPSSGHLTQSVFRGFAFFGFYLFIRTFPDNDPAVRSGRVLSHTLIVDQSDLYKLNDLSPLFSHFISAPEKDPNLSAIVIDNGKAGPAQIVNVKSREAAAINGLLHLSSSNNTIVWIGYEGYPSFVANVWSQLEGSLRARLKLGVGFSPHKVDVQNHNILYVMEDYANKWEAGGACVIGKEELGTLSSMSSFLLAGNKEKSKPLQEMIRAFEIVPTEIEDYRYLETGVSTYSNLSPTIEFNRLIVLCDLISKYSPDAKVAQTAKHELLSYVKAKVPLASADQINKLKNVDWTGLGNAEQLIGGQIANWIKTSLFILEVDESVVGVIGAAFDLENEVEWWKEAFLGGLKTAFSNWKATYAVVIWKWFGWNIDLVGTLGRLIPTSHGAESDFVACWQELQPKLVQQVNVFAQKRKWLTLHGLSLLQLYSPEESVRKQLAIDSDPGYSDALNKMGQFLPDMEFLQLTVNIGEQRLVNIAGLKAAKTPSLLNPLDVKNDIWRQIWLESIEQGAPLWSGITDPLEVLYALMEEVLKGVEIESRLLLMISKSEWNDLASFEERAKVWQYLNVNVKAGFINATAMGCVRLMGHGNICIDDLEPDIRKWLLDVANVKQLVEDKTINVSTKLQLFEELPGLKEHEFIMLLNAGQYSATESERLGKLILLKRWKKATDSIVHGISAGREDLKLALKEFQSLLGFFQKLTLTLSGDLSGTISNEEWWAEFIEQCYMKYSHGPKENGLWERAGGQNCDLLVNGSGREIWLDTMRKMRNGKTNVDALKILREMLKDFSSSGELQQLEESCR